MCVVGETENLCLLDFEYVRRAKTASIDTPKISKDDNLATRLRASNVGLLWRRIDRRETSLKAIVCFTTLVEGTSVIYNQANPNTLSKLWDHLSPRHYIGAKRPPGFSRGWRLPETSVDDRIESLLELFRLAQTGLELVSREGGGVGKGPSESQG